MINELFRTERVRVADLVPHVKNPRKIKAESKKSLWERLQKYGMIGIPVRDFDGTLLSGHQRCELIVQNGLGEHEMDVRTAVRKLTEAELKEVMMIENSHAGEFDLDLLKSEFQEFVNLDDFGIDLSELDKQLSAMTDESSPEAELPIVAKMSERYTSFVIVCRNEIDENHIAEKLGIERGQCYKSSKVGMMHVMPATKLIETWK
ncbi:MAG: hypothetical protein U0X91_20745 [Spirosomataceae bacterium]